MQVQSLINDALPEVGSDLHAAYAKELLQEGYSNIASIAKMSDGDWPQAIRRGHRQRIREAAAALEKGACCRCGVQ